MTARPISSLIVIVDIERFGERPDMVQAELRRDLYRTVQDALAEAGVAWDACHREDRGDGMILLLPGAGPVELLGAFVREVDAALRARNASRAPGYRMRLRVVVHHGFVWHDGRGWVGTAVNTAARLVDASAARSALRAAEGAQLVLVVGDELHRDVIRQGHPSIDARAFREVRVRAKEVDTRAWIRVPGVVPAGGCVRRGGVPTPLTTLVGREDDARRVVALLERSRLVTLVGPAGIGKTRLSWAVATAVADRFAQGAVFVPLADATTEDEVVAAVATELQTTQTAGQPLREAVMDRLCDASLLLVLDNFEQVIESATLVAAVLASAPQVTVLVTSRERLAVYGEQVFRVPPLALPDLDAQPAGADRVARALAQSPAIRLFEQRAQAVEPDFALTGENLVAVSELCRRLDGLPLAVELAAARVDRWLPVDLATQLNQQLDVLGPGPRDQPARQKTLRGAIDWSHALLDLADQLLFETLAVFVGGMTVEAVEAVSVTRGDIGNRLGQLMDKSLLAVEFDPDGSRRYRMLETIRRYALERLRAREQADAVHERHARFFVTFAERCGTGMTGPQQATWTERADRDYGNLRAALGWLLEHHEFVLSARICLGLWRYWRNGSSLAEGRTWLAQVLADPRRLPPAVHAEMLCASALLAAGQDDHEAVQRLAEQALALARSGGEPAMTARAHNALGVAAIESGDFDGAAAHLRQSLLICEKLDETHGTAVALGNLTKVALRLGDVARASEYNRRCLELTRSTGNARDIGLTLEATGQIRLAQGDFGGARAALEEGLEISRALRDIFGQATALHGLGLVAHADGDTARARRLLAQAIVHWYEVGDREDLAVSLDRLANVLLPEDPEFAARLITAADEVRRRYRLPEPPDSQTCRATTTAALRGLLGDTPPVTPGGTARSVPLASVIDRTRTLAF